MADDDDEPSATRGRFGLVLAGRSNIGALGDQYWGGFLWGVHAGLERRVEDSDWSVGLGWTTLVRGYYFETGDSQVESTIHLTEVNVGIRAAHAFLVPGQNLFGGAGAVVLLSNLPVPPANERRYLGWYAGFGFERAAFGEWAWTVEARYSRPDQGLDSVSLVTGMTAGF